MVCPSATWWQDRAYRLSCYTGLAGVQGDWRWVIPQLARVYRVYAPEFPTTRPQASSVVPVFSARFISAFLNSLGIEQATLVGNSVGGLAALRFALAHPGELAVGTVLARPAARLPSSHAG
jgi:pimeloyl-ACP methyl ester carboxylesterase